MRKWRDQANLCAVRKKGACSWLDQQLRASSITFTTAAVTEITSRSTHSGFDVQNGQGEAVAEAQPVACRCALVALVNSAQLLPHRQWSLRASRKRTWSHGECLGKNVQVTRCGRSIRTATRGPRSPVKDGRSCRQLRLRHYGLYHPACNARVAQVQLLSQKRTIKCTRSTYGERCMGTRLAIMSEICIG